MRARPEQHQSTIRAPPEHHQSTNHSTITAPSEHHLTRFSAPSSNSQLTINGQPSEELFTAGADGMVLRWLQDTEQNCNIYQCVEDIKVGHTCSCSCSYIEVGLGFEALAQGGIGARGTGAEHHQDVASPRSVGRYRTSLNPKPACATLCATLSICRCTKITSARKPHRPLTPVNPY
jgi:hypothetical protein